MSKYEPTQEELEAFIRRAGFSYGWENLESWARSMARQACAELRERESARAAVTDEIRAHASFIYRKTTDGNCNELGMLNALEAIAPMLASARVPDAIINDDGIYTAYENGWNTCRAAMLTAAPKPETEE